MRCPSTHPELGLQCERLANTCWGLDHTAKDVAGETIFWADPEPTDAIGKFFRAWMAARRRAMRGSELEDWEIRKIVSWAIKDEPDELDNGKHE
jgi:hypothetical protein